MKHASGAIAVATSGLATVGDSFGSVTINTSPGALAINGPSADCVTLDDGNSSAVARLGDVIRLLDGFAGPLTFSTEKVAADKPRRVRVRVTREEAAKVGASEVLAIDAGLFGRVIVLNESAPLNASEQAYAEDDEAAAPATKSAEGVSIVTVMGPLCQRAEPGLCGYVDGYDAIGDRFEAACSDPSTTAIVLRLDSPGGDVQGLEQMIDRCVKARDASGKPVLVFVDEMAASAAYWTAAALATPAANGGGIFLTACGRVGSIGVIAGMVDESEAWKREGIDIQLIRCPDGKADAHPAQPVMPLALERITARVRMLGDRFFGAMAKARGLTAAEVEGFNAAMFDGADAIKARLADGVVKDIHAVLAKASKAAKTARKSRQQKAEAMQLDALIAKHNVKDGAALDAMIDGLAAKAETLGEMAAKVAVLEAQIAADKAERDAAEAAAKVAAEAAAKAQADADAAAKIAARNLSDVAKSRAEALYAKHGPEVLADFLAAIPEHGAPPAAADRGEPQVKQAGPVPAATAKTYAESTFVERHNFHVANGAEAYRAWKAAG